MQKKNIFTAAFCICFMSAAFSQVALSGKITDNSTREPLPGVTVYLPDLRLAVSTDASGRYGFSRIRAGSYLIEVALIGYKKLVRKIDLAHDTAVDFSLSASVSELNEVVVTGVGRNTELKLSPVIIKPVEAGELYQNSSTNLIDALRNVPGVSQISTGAGISKPVIRGLGYNRVISLYNGIRQEGQQWGDEHGIEIDQYSIDRIEIVKGPGSLMYGPDGIAGVLNFISAPFPPPGAITTRLVSDYQTNNHLVGYSLSNAGNKRGLQWLGRLSGKMAGDYSNRYDGKVYNSGFSEFDGSISAGINRKWGYAQLSLSSFSTTLNMVEGKRDSLGRFTVEVPDGNGSTMAIAARPQDLSGYQTGFPHQQVRHLRALVNNYFLLHNGSVNLDIGVQNNRRLEFGDVLQPRDAALYFDLNTFNYNARYNLLPWRGWETSAGVGGMLQQNRNRGKEFLIPGYDLFDAGAFVLTQRTKNKVTFAGGLRFDTRSLLTRTLILDTLGVPASQSDSSTRTKFSGFAKRYQNFSGSIGVTYQLDPKSTVKLNLSRGFRAPNIAELTSNGHHEGTLRYEYGNYDLLPEVSHQLDVAYFLNSDHFTFEATPFANVITHYIYSEKLESALGGDSIPDPSDPIAAYRFTQGTALLAGGELYCDLHPHPFDWLHIGNSFSFVQATQLKQPDSTRYLPFIPPPRYRGEIKATFRKAGSALNNLYLRLAVDRYFAQDRFFKAYGTETRTPGYTLVSAGCGGSISGFKRNDFLTIFVSAENLGDAAYQSHLSRLKYAPLNPATQRRGVYNMGRNFSVKIIVSL